MKPGMKTKAAIIRGSGKAFRTAKMRFFRLLALARSLRHRARICRRSSFPVDESALLVRGKWSHKEAAMLTWTDCVELSELTEDEIDAIAQHEHIPEMIALEMGNYLIHTHTGEKRVKAMIRDDIRLAEEEGKKDRVAMLKLVLKHYLEHHHG
jgi:hypothetical protein